MLSVKNKIVLVTGASSGIGMACVKEFVQLGAKVIMGARRVEKMHQMVDELNLPKDQILIIELDVQHQPNVEAAIQSLPDAWKDIDILVNNAGLALSSEPIHQGDPKNWDIMIDTNVKGVLYVTRAVLADMVKKKAGHIINIGSIAGQNCYPGGNVYAATKHAVRAISQSLRLDLMGTHVRVSEVEPGAVETEFSEVRWNDKEKAKAFYSDFVPLVGEDIADAVVYCATRKPHVNISEIVVMPVAQASINHIYRGKM
jgi:3-hydroxy acid dehydrogenase/malonic semialdehyde reductase